MMIIISSLYVVLGSFMCKNTNAPHTPVIMMMREKDRSELRVYDIAVPLIFYFEE